MSRCTIGTCIGSGADSSDMAFHDVCVWCGWRNCTSKDMARRDGVTGLCRWSSCPCSHLRRRGGSCSSRRLPEDVVSVSRAEVMVSKIRQSTMNFIVSTSSSQVLWPMISRRQAAGISHVRLRNIQLDSHTLPGTVFASVAHATSAKRSDMLTIDGEFDAGWQLLRHLPAM